MSHAPHLVRRFWTHVHRDPEGCWTWTGTLNDGYGRFRVSPTVRKYAHVFLYEVENGPVPEGLQLDHLCRNRACVRPDHLEVVTGYVNTLRGTSPPAKNARKHFCVHGHEFTEKNTLWKDDRRNCRTCKRAAQDRLKKKVSSAKRKPKPKATQLEKDRDEGMTWTAIGIKYGVSDTAARKWGKQMGIQ